MLLIWNYPGPQVPLEVTFSVAITLPPIIIVPLEHLFVAPYSIGVSIGVLYSVTISCVYWHWGGGGWGSFYCYTATFFPEGLQQLCTLLL